MKSHVEASYNYSLGPAATVSVIGMLANSPISTSNSGQIVFDTQLLSNSPRRFTLSTPKVRDPHPIESPFYLDQIADDPLNGSCSVSYSRDCGASGCILSALSNYTHRLSLKSLPATESTQALYFVTHFLGDIGQPLHVENYEVGGNSIAATCGGNSTNLHSVKHDFSS